MVLNEVFLVASRHWGRERGGAACGQELHPFYHQRVVKYLQKHAEFEKDNTEDEVCEYSMHHSLAER